MFAAAAVPQLHALHSEQDASGNGLIVRYPLGNRSACELVRGIWNEEDAADVTVRGHENKRVVTLTLFDVDIPLDARDEFGLLLEMLPTGVSLGSGFPSDNVWKTYAQAPPAESIWRCRSIAYGTVPSIDIKLERRDLEIRTGKGGAVL